MPQLTAIQKRKRRKSQPSVSTLYAGDYADGSLEQMLLAPEHHQAGLLLVGQGQTPCIVWPGDVNNDGIVNYGDRAALNKYIFDANLRASWLSGPARYRADYLTNPMTYFTWEGQAGAPWQTADGCYMDADGNGTVNNWDLLPVKTNFLRTHGLTPKAEDGALAGSFGLAQNYPNPFNPSTTLQYAVPEKSTVKITVTDMIGRVDVYFP